jgi:predicted nucleic acid-binding protein
MVVVLDASVAVAWAMEDELSPVADAALALVTKQEGFVPALWPWEVGNALVANWRRKRLSMSALRQALELIATLPIKRDDDTTVRAWGSTLALAERLGLSLYDAAYLDLAKRRGLPLATLDEGLRKAAVAEGIVLLGEAA